MLLGSRVSGSATWICQYGVNIYKLTTERSQGLLFLSQNILMTGCAAFTCGASQ